MDAVGGHNRGGSADTRDSVRVDELMDGEPSDEEIGNNDPESTPVNA